MWILRFKIGLANGSVGAAGQLIFLAIKGVSVTFMWILILGMAKFDSKLADLTWG
jgi:hypothetical protein